MILTDLAGVKTMFGRKTRLLLQEAQIALALAQAHNASQEREYERLLLDYDAMKVDYRRLVEIVGNVNMGRALSRPDFELDPYKENEKMPDEWMSPDPDDLIKHETELIERAMEAASQQDLTPDGNG